MTDEAAKALLARLQSRWPDEDCRQATTLIERLSRELARCGRDNCMGQQVDGVQRWVTEAALAASQADVLRLREALEQIADHHFKATVGPPADMLEDWMTAVSRLRSMARSALNTTSPTAEHGGRDGK